MYARVTRLAQRDQVTAIVCTTFTQRQLVMDFFSRHDNSTFKTQLTERMLRSVLVTDSLPCTTVYSKNPDWEFAGIYADDGISGTNTKNVKNSIT